MVVLLASKSSQRTIQLSVQGDGDYQDFRDLFPLDLLVQSLSRRHPEVIHTLCLRALQIVYYLERAHCVCFFFTFICMYSFFFVRFLVFDSPVCFFDTLSSHYSFFRQPFCASRCIFFLPAARSSCTRAVCPP